MIERLLDDEQTNSANLPRRCGSSMHAVTGDNRMRKVQPKMRLSLLQQQILRQLDTNALRIMRYGTAEEKTALVAWGIPWNIMSPKIWTTQ
jgi:hypothetical protein